MAYFTAIGTISNDIVRRETKKGVAATFRLETGAPRGRKLWIDIECWGHLAGTVAHHGRRGRSLAACGELIEKQWRDRQSGERRSRLLFVPIQARLIAQGRKYPAQNCLTVTGVVASQPIAETRSSGSTLLYSLRCDGTARSQAPSDLGCRTWHPNESGLPPISKGDLVSGTGPLSYSLSQRQILFCPTANSLRTCREGGPASGHGRTPELI